MKKTLGGCLTSAPVSALLARRRRERLHILYAHHFGEARPYLPRRLPLEHLSDTLRLSARFCEFCSLDELLQPADGSASAALPKVALTFDDGLDLFREGVLEVLRAHSIKATFFLLTGCLDNRSLMWRHLLYAIRNLRGEERLRAGVSALCERLPAAARAPAGANPMRQAFYWPMRQKESLADELWRRCDMPPLAEFLQEHRPYFTTDQVRTLLREGHAIGLHTRTHPVSDRLDSEQVREEYHEPLAWLQARFGLIRMPVSFPFGRRLPEPELESLRSTGGITCALGTEGLSRLGTDPFSLERASIEQDSAWTVFSRPYLPGRWDRRRGDS